MWKPSTCTISGLVSWCHLSQIFLCIITGWVMVEQNSIEGMRNECGESTEMEESTSFWNLWSHNTALTLSWGWGFAVPCCDCQREWLASLEICHLHPGTQQVASLAKVRELTDCCQSFISSCWKRVRASGPDTQAVKEGIFCPPCAPPVLWSAVGSQGSESRPTSLLGPTAQAVVHS